MFERAEEIRVGLAGEAADDIRPDPAARDALADAGDEICELPGPIPPLHPREDGVATALERDVEMPREFR